MPANGKIIMGSSPNGKKNYFYKLWAEDNKFYKYSPSIYDHPDFTKEKLVEYRGALGEKGWRQEALAEFLD